MKELQASRTLVKSPPELWAECSDAAALARHLGAFGEIRITRLDPETAVAWEGENVRGTVQIEPSGWGTKVTLTAERGAGEAPPPEAIEAPAEPAAEPAAEPQPPRRRRFARLLAWRRVPEPEVPAPVPVLESEPTTEAPSGTEDALTAALDSLGQAHHRPYSRA
jgi:hypothetical protein